MRVTPLGVSRVPASVSSRASPSGGNCPRGAASGSGRGVAYVKRSVNDTVAPELTRPEKAASTKAAMAYGPDIGADAVTVIPAACMARCVAIAT